MIKKISVLSLLLLLLLLVQNTDAYGSLKISEGMEFKAIQPITIRQTPPGQKMYFLVSSPGKKVAQLNTGDIVKIKQIKTIDTPLDKDVWAYVEYKPCPGQINNGWVYFGTNEKLENFVKLPGGQ